MREKKGFELDTIFIERSDFQKALNRFAILRIFEYLAAVYAFTFYGPLIQLVAKCAEFICVSAQNDTNTHVHINVGFIQNNRNPSKGILFLLYTYGF